MKNLVKELRVVHASELHPDSRNYRTHPRGQQTTLSKMIERIGYVNPIIARETAEGLVIIDGHLRRALLPDEQIPVVIVDVDEKQAAELMMTLDPIAAQAEADADLLRRLIEEAPDIDEIMLGGLGAMADEADLTVPEDDLPEPADDDPDLELTFTIKMPASESAQADKFRQRLETLVEKFPSARIA